MDWSQSRLNFDAGKLHALGVRHIYVLPGYSTGDWYCDEDTFRARLEELRKKKADAESKYPDVQVHFFGYTAGHPEGQARVPPQYQSQVDIDGHTREGYACLADASYREVLLDRFRRVARAGFHRLLLDDDFKDGLCFCPLHMQAFSKVLGRRVAREELTVAYRDASGSGESIELRRQYIAFSRENLLSFARDIERAVHEVEPRLRLGICISARRFLDLSGISCTDIIDIFDTPEAPAFGRLPGEHYTALPLDMACSVGYHTYYDSLLPEKYERAWELTVVALAPYQPKTSSQMVQEWRIAKSVGLGPVHWAWTEDFEKLHLWPGLIEGVSQRSGTVPSQRGDRRYLGIPVFVQPKQAHELPLDEHLTDGAIRGYQALSLAGLPLRLATELRPEDETVCLFGPQPRTVADLAESWLAERRMLIVDMPAARSLGARLGGLTLADPTRGPHLQVSAGGETDCSVAGFPIGSMAAVEGDELRPITRFLDASGRDVGTAIASSQVDEGRALVLPFDLSKVTFRVSTAFYRELLVKEISELASGRLPHMEGDAFLHLVLFEEDGESRFITANYSDHPTRAEICSSDGPSPINMGPLSVETGRLKKVPCRTAR